MSTGDRKRTTARRSIIHSHRVAGAWRRLRLRRAAAAGETTEMSVEIRAIAPRRAWRTSALGVLLALGFFSLPVGSWIHDDASVANHLGFELIVWAWVAGILLYVIRVERRPLSTIGSALSPSRTAIIAILAGILILALLALISFVVFPALHWSERAVRRHRYFPALLAQCAHRRAGRGLGGDPLSRVPDRAPGGADRQSHGGVRCVDLRGVHARSHRLLGLAPHLHCGLGRGRLLTLSLSLAPQHLAEHDRAFRGGCGRFPGVTGSGPRAVPAHRIGAFRAPIRCKPARRRPDCGYGFAMCPAGGPSRATRMSDNVLSPLSSAQRPWDARLARRLVTPLK